MLSSNEIQTIKFPKKYFIDNELGLSPRVVDLCHETRDMPEWSFDVNNYDKNMSMVIKFVRYYEALRATEQNSDEIDALRAELYELVDEAYTLFETEIKKNEAEIIFHRSSVKDILIKIKEQIAVAVSLRQDPRGLLEFALIKLAMLRDLSLGKVMGILEMASIHSKIHTDFYNKPVEHYARMILDAPLDKKSIVNQSMIFSFAKFKPNCSEQAYDNTFSNIIPIFSRTGTLGFNTILYALSKGFYVVGFGANPHSVHMDLFNGESLDTARHDYFHIFHRIIILKEKYPKLMSAYLSIYRQLLQDKHNEKMNNMAFRKELFFLFVLIFEAAINTYKSVFNYIFLIDLLNLHDFKMILTRLGYRIRDHYIEADTKKTLLELLIDFEQRYPHVNFNVVDSIRVNATDLILSSHTDINSLLNKLSVYKNAVDRQKDILSEIMMLLVSQMQEQGLIENISRENLQFIIQTIDHPLTTMLLNVKLAQKNERTRLLLFSQVSPDLLLMISNIKSRKITIEEANIENNIAYKNELANNPFLNDIYSFLKDRSLLESAYKTWKPKQNAREIFQIWESQDQSQGQSEGLTLNRKMGK